MSRLRAWFRGLIADDPTPEYSRLDQLDGLQPSPDGGMEDRAQFAALAKKVAR